MSEKLRIKSKIRNYSVNFIDGFQKSIEQNSNENAYILVDKKVQELFGDQFEPIYTKCHFITIQATEANKTIDYCQSLIQSLIEKRIRKNCVLIAVGGGIIQDIVSFTSSILFRGIAWVFYPTTLLAQADSCIGGKTSINLGGYKNLVGNFYPPAEINLDLAFLETLPEVEIKSGIGEILHFYFYANSSLIEGLTNNYDELIKNPKLLRKYIYESLTIKKKVIEIDEFDEDERNKFNYGHTFGHALESLTNYGISHGQAVTVGMDIANYLSQKLGYMDKETFKALHDVLIKNFPKLDITKYNLEAYYEALSKDKKNVGNDLVCILAANAGSLHKVRLPFDDKTKTIISSYFNLF